MTKTQQYYFFYCLKLDDFKYELLEVKHYSSILFI